MEVDDPERLSGAEGNRPGSQGMGQGNPQQQIFLVQVFPDQGTLERGRKLLDQDNAQVQGSVVQHVILVRHNLFHQGKIDVGIALVELLIDGSKSIDAVFMGQAQGNQAADADWRSLSWVRVFRRIRRISVALSTMSRPAGVISRWWLSRFKDLYSQLVLQLDQLLIQPDWVMNSFWAALEMLPQSAMVTI